MHNSQKNNKRVLVAKAKSPSSSCPYLKLIEKYKVTIDFVPFVRTEPISLPEFRKFKAKILLHTALIFTNKTAIDHFFQLTKATNLHLPESINYFCVTELLANYLQKYIVLKKRKVFTGEGDIVSFFANLKKHKKEKFLIPCSSTSRKDVIGVLKENQLNYFKTKVYNILDNDLTKLVAESYDIIVFFSLLDVKAFVKNFPKFTSKHTRIAVFGPETAKAIKEAGLSFHIYAPRPQIVSMADALDDYLKKNIMA